jgi:hypothetical protein
MLWGIFRAIGTLIRNLLQFNVFVRGAITRGGAPHSQQYVYGTAVSRAAVLEKNAAKGPLPSVALLGEWAELGNREGKERAADEPLANLSVQGGCARTSLILEDKEWHQVDRSRS